MSTDNIHNGHRKRMMQKYLKNGTSAFEEHELLEMLLFILLPRVNTNIISHELLNHFGSLDNVFNTAPDELASINGIGGKTAAELRFLGDIINYINHRRGDKVKFSASTSIVDFCIEHFRSSERECLAFFLLDEKGTLIFCDEHDTEKPNEVVFDYKFIMKKTVTMDADAVIISHNHPNGMAVASNSDVTATRKLNMLLKTIDVKLIDHIIVSGKNGFSLRKSGSVTDIWY